MVITTVLLTLWRMLDAKRRVVFLGLLVSLFVTGVFEMVGMLVVFGFIKGLTVDPAAGTRHGPVGKLIGWLFGDPLTDPQFAVVGGSMVMAIVLMKNVQSMTVRYQLSRFLSNLNRRVSERLFAGFLLAPYIDLRTEEHGRPGEVIRSNMHVVSVCFQSTARVLADGAVVSVVVLALMFVDPWLTIGAVLLFGIAGTTIYQTLSRKLKQLGREGRESRQMVDRYLNESFRALIETRLRDNVQFFLTRFHLGLRSSLATQRSQQALARVPRSANEILLALGVTGAVVYMVLSGSDLSSFLPTLVVFGFAGLRTTGAMSRLNAGLQALRRHAEEFERQRQALIQVAPQVFQDELEAPQTYMDDERSAGNRARFSFRRGLEVNQVTFKYPAAEQPSVDHVSLSIRPGTFVAFCGESGGGKSTLLLLLMGMMPPTSGSILCDGQNIQHHVRAWHREIGYVGQELFVSSATVRGNVAFGTAEHAIDDARVERALRQAAAWDFVSTLPEGIHTRLKNDASRLSGGQKQRIVIARALYHDPHILVFDEATSALDNETEKEITGALQALRDAKTIICVAHRLSSIRQADEIFVMQEGSVVAHGTYDDLLRESEYFRKLANELATDESRNALRASS